MALDDPAQCLDRGTAVGFRVFDRCVAQVVYVTGEGMQQVGALGEIAVQGAAAHLGGRGDVAERGGGLSASTDMAASRIALRVRERAATLFNCDTDMSSNVAHNYQNGT